MTPQERILAIYASTGIVYVVTLVICFIAITTHDEQTRGQCIVALVGAAAFGGNPLFNFLGIMPHKNTSPDGTTTTTDSPNATITTVVKETS